MGYGAEIWGWEERKEIEGIHERLIRSTLGVDWKTPGYMIREEVKRDKMRTRAGRRAWKYEEKLWKGEGSEIVRECLKEIKETERERGENISEWERGRGIVKEQGRIIQREEEGQEKEENKGHEKIEREDRKEQERERYEKIR